MPVTMLSEIPDLVPFDKGFGSPSLENYSNHRNNWKALPTELEYST